MQNLIVFAKRPILGKVKTRLAEDLGEETALEIYKNMLDETRSLASEWMARSETFRQVHWFWDRDGEPEPEEDKPVFIPTYFELPSLFMEYFQEPDMDLGDRMALAFDEIFSWEGHDDAVLGSNWKERFMDEVEESMEKFDEEGNRIPVMGRGHGVVIIGTDCPDLNLEILEKAFDGLHTAEVSIGPAMDGGYYLLGMDDFYPELFWDVEWSTVNVFTKTLENTEELGLSVEELPILKDIDTVEDLEED